VDDVLSAICGRPGCSVEVIQPSTGRRRRFCSSACKQADFRRRRRQAPGVTKRQTVDVDGATFVTPPAPGVPEIGARCRVVDEHRWAGGYLGTVDMVSLGRGRKTTWVRLRVDAPGLPYATLPARPQAYQDTIWLAPGELLAAVDCEWCGGAITDGSTCPRSLPCSCGAKPGGPCYRPSGHKAPELHGERVQAAQALDDELVAAA
jgi:endogenous inhibitor of DNA gyrase (YacG/DUF329 family)